MNLIKLKLFSSSIAPIVLRLGMSAVILWFGVEQIIDTQSWIGFLPAWTASLPVGGDMLVHLNGYFEIIFGGFMAIGLYTRFTSFLLALHLFDIAYIVGYDALGVRDAGLAIATLTVFLYGKDILCIDTWFEGSSTTTDTAPSNQQTI